MRFKCKKSQAEKDASYKAYLALCQWHDWFAWRPVCSDEEAGTCEWWVVVQRRRVGDFWCYRSKP